MIAILATACNVTWWPSDRSGPSLSGFNAGETTISATNVSTLVQDWYATDWSVPGTTSRTTSSPVVVADRLYAGSGKGYLEAYNATGCGHISTAANPCSPLWVGKLTAPVDAAPVVDDDKVFVVSDGSAAGAGAAHLAAFSTTPPSSCAPAQLNAPPTCPALWEADASSAIAAPTVAGGVVYVNDAGTSPPQLEAYDEAGVLGCSGSPVHCAPLWTAPITSTTPIAVAGRFVYDATTTGAIDVYDSAGTLGCAGSPKVCAPLRTTPAMTASGVSGAPVVTGGRLVHHAANHVDVFDAAGTTGCGGTAVVCQPLWTALDASTDAHVELAVAYGDVYVPTSAGNVEVFDLAGVNGCTSAAPVTCTPMRTITAASAPGLTGLAHGSLTIANGVGYLATWTTSTPTFDGELVAFDARSTASCTGAPLVCPRLWAVSVGGAATTPAVANGHVYLETVDGALRRFTPHASS